MQLIPYQPRGLILFSSAIPTSLVIGKVINEKEDPKLLNLKANETGIIEEYLCMLNVEVELKDPSLIPSNTQAYPELRWVTEQQYREMIVAKDILVLPDTFSSSGFCTHGMCLASTYISLDNV